MIGNRYVKQACDTRNIVKSMPYFHYEDFDGFYKYIPKDTQIVEVELTNEVSEAMTALSYLAPGMPLIYSGQEYDLDHRLLFFEKDEIPHAKGNMWPVLEKLGQLKAENPALHGGKNAADYERINIDNDAILAFKRSKAGKSVIYIANLSNETVVVDLSEIKGEYLDYMANTKLLIESTVELKADTYKILVN